MRDVLRDAGDGPLDCFFHALAVWRHGVGIEINEEGAPDDPGVVISLTAADYRKFQAEILSAWREVLADPENFILDVPAAIKAGIERGLKFIGVKVEQKVPAQNGKTRTGTSTAQCGPLPR